MSWPSGEKTTLVVVMCAGSPSKTCTGRLKERRSHSWQGCSEKKGKKQWSQWYLYA